jgi:predicted ribosomally synthesized peptide with nif11-like leader
MSQSEVERFVADLKSDASLREALKGSAAGVASVVAFAQARGYDIGADEARQYIQAQSSNDLTDAELDHVAGGKGHHSTSTSTVQTTQSATTQTVAAETSIGVVAEVYVAGVVVVT